MEQTKGWGAHCWGTWGATTCSQGTRPGPTRWIYRIARVHETKEALATDRPKRQPTEPLQEWLSSSGSHQSAPYFLASSDFKRKHETAWSPS